MDTNISLAIIFICMATIGIVILIDHLIKQVKGIWSLLGSIYEYINGIDMANRSRQAEITGYVQREGKKTRQRIGQVKATLADEESDDQILKSKSRNSAMKIRGGQ